MMAGTGRELAVAHGAQLRAQGLLGDLHAELLPDPLAEVDETPAHDPMDGGCRSGLDQFGQRRPVLGRQSRRRAGSLAVDQAGGPMGVELHHPVADDLHGHAADPCRFTARRSLVDRGQRETPSRLRAILRSFRRKAARVSVEIRSQCNRHGEHPPVRHP